MSTFHLKRECYKSTDYRRYEFSDPSGRKAISFSNPSGGDTFTIQESGGIPLGMDLNQTLEWLQGLTESLEALRDMQDFSASVGDDS